MCEAHCMAECLGRGRETAAGRRSRAEPKRPRTTLLTAVGARRAASSWLGTACARVQDARRAAIQGRGDKCLQAGSKRGNSERISHGSEVRFLLVQFSLFSDRPCGLSKTRRSHGSLMLTMQLLQ